MHEISVWEGAMWGLSGHPPAGTLEVTHTGLCGEGVRVHVIPASWEELTPVAGSLGRWRRALVFKNAQDIHQMGNGSEKYAVPDGHVVPHLILIPATII